MANLNIIEILKLGLPGLVFLLSLLSYFLLRKEQERTTPNDKNLNAIRHFMNLNILLAALTLSASIFDKDKTIFDTTAKTSGESLNKGIATVCDTNHVNRYLLIKDIETGKAIQVFTKNVIPCKDEDYIFLAIEDVTNLGWTNKKDSSTVQVAMASPGQMFVIENK